MVAQGEVQGTVVPYVSAAAARLQFPPKHLLFRSPLLDVTLPTAAVIIVQSHVLLQPYRAFSNSLIRNLEAFANLPALVLQIWLATTGRNSLRRNATTRIPSSRSRSWTSPSRRLRRILFSWCATLTLLLHFLTLIVDQAWKADLSLQLNQEPKIVVTLLQQAWKQPGLTDTQLLSYMYRLLAEATRKQQDNGQHFSSVGNENEKVWQDAAKALGRKDERKELWSELGRVSLREECWEDFRKVRRCTSV
jgi:hypothetical protein